MQQSIRSFIYKVIHKIYTFVHCHDPILVQLFVNIRITFGSIILRMFISYLSHGHVASVFLLLSVYLGVKSLEGEAEI